VTLRVQVVMAWPHRVEAAWCELPEGARVGDALASACLPDQENASGVAVFGVSAGMDTLLHDGDRVELLRPLLADPKESRRRRAEAARR